ncbi:nucleobindin-2 [Protobothrops mucrosquamatus]|uniref:nucleobindin-2 n=1 Tax=Protobothrops mucrosquamatus TaxID=103944 RepID=UPI0010FBA4AC|nr:nucleobindin-2 [Protobothrops mucrosquamatus]
MVIIYVYIYILKDTGLYYDVYLRQVIEVLETNKHFREKLQTADIEEIKSGKLSKELDLVGHKVRTKLDELKRQEVARLRMLIKAKIDAYQDSGVDHQALLKQFGHLNHHNPHTFEVKDLDMLIKTVSVQQIFSQMLRWRQRHKKNELLPPPSVSNIYDGIVDDEHCSFVKSFAQMVFTINFQGSKDQLKEVWEEADGLDPNDFDPKTFFKLHDVNADGFLDEQELEALFTRELEKVYDPRNEEDPKDRLVTLEEFMRATEKREFLEPESWETLDQQQVFTEEDLKDFESHIFQKEDELQKQALELQKKREELQQQQDFLQAQKQELEMAVKQMEQKKLQQGHPPSGPGGELKFQPSVSQLDGNVQNHPVSSNQPLAPGNIPVQEAAARSDHAQSHP